MVQLLVPQTYAIALYAGAGVGHDKKAFLSIALDSVIEACRKNPDTYANIIFNDNANNDVSRIIHAPELIGRK